MTAAARVYVLTKDDNDRDQWGDPIFILDGHWNPFSALRHFFEDEEPDAGTYRCESSGGTATVGWTGEHIDLEAA